MKRIQSIRYVLLFFILAFVLSPLDMSFSQQEKSADIIEIKVGEYKRDIEADAIIELLKGLKYKPYQKRISKKDGSTAYQVFMGPYKNREEAEKDLGELNKLGIKAEIITTPGPQQKIIAPQVPAGYFLKIGEYAQAFEAAALTDYLEKFKFPVVKGKLKKATGDIVTEILVGPYPNRKDANSAREKLDERNIQAQLIVPQPSASQSSVQGVKTVTVTTYAIHVGDYSLEIEAKAMADLLKKYKFPVFQESVKEKDKTTYQVFVGPYANGKRASQIRADLEKRGAAARVVPHSVVEEEQAPTVEKLFSWRISRAQRIELLSAASMGVQTIPVVNIKRRMSEQEASTLAKQITDELGHSAVKYLITHLAVYGLNGPLHDALHRAGFNLIRIVTPLSVREFVNSGERIGNDMIFIDGDPAQIIRVVNELLTVVPSSRIIIVKYPNMVTPPGVITTEKIGK